MATTKHEFLARSITVAFALAAVGLVATACGTTVINNTTNCGIGTTLVNGTCVGTAIDAGGDTTAVGPDGEVPSDGSPAIDTGGDAQPIEPDEPCPVANATTEVINCDAKCGPVDNALCNVGSCASVAEPDHTYPAFSTDSLRPTTTTLILRLPADPWLVFGECDPNSEQIGETAYTRDLRETPQPKYFAVVPWPVQFAVIGIGRPTGKIATRAGRYATRVLTWVTHVSTADPPARRRIQPLHKSAFPQEADRSGCVYHAIEEHCPTLATLNCRSPQEFPIVFHTSRTHIAATNIEITTIANACTVQP
jgi:hypothetical protein